jgi:uncharacterized protein (TIGR03067 family)
LREHKETAVPHFHQPNHHKTIIASLCLTLTFVANSARAADESAAKQELKQIAGVWSFESVKVNGERQSAAGHVQDRLIFQEDGRFTVVQQPGITHGTYKIVPGHTPKQYDVHIDTGRLKGIDVPAIYEISGDTLTVCMPLGGNERPTAVESKPGDGRLFEVFKRQHESIKDALIAAGRRELAGTWQAATYALDGQKASEEDLKKIQLVFDPQGNTQALNDGKLFIASSTQLDPTANPATIDITFTGGEGKGATSLGLYKIEGGVLTICRAAPGKPRPTEFASNPGSGLTLMSYKKAGGPKSGGPRRFRAQPPAQ